MKIRFHYSLLLPLAGILSAQTPEPVDQRVIARIKTEGLQHSRVMDSLFYLTDVHGPRLRGSPNYKAAADWVVQALAGWGVSRARLEPGGFNGRGWTVNRFSVEMMAPQYQHLTAFPLAWSPAIKGVLSGQPVLADIASPDDFPKYRGKLRGAIVLVGKPREQPATHFEADARRFTDDDLKRGAQALVPEQKILDSSDGPAYAQNEKVRRDKLAGRAAIARFLLDEGVAAALTSSPLDSGVLTAIDAGGFDIDSPNFKLPAPELTVPSFVLAREHYGRIYRLLEHQLPVTLELNLQVTISDAGPGYNVVADLPAGSTPSTAAAWRTPSRRTWRATRRRRRPPRPRWTTSS